MATLHSPYLVDPEPQTPITHSNAIFMAFTISCCHLHFYLLTTGISQDRLGYAVVTNNPQISAPQERGTFLSCAVWPSRAGCAPAACHLPSRTQAEGQRKHNMANHVSALNMEPGLSQRAEITLLPQHRLPTIMLSTTLLSTNVDLTFSLSKFEEMESPPLLAMSRGNHENECMTLKSNTACSHMT